MSTNKKWTFKLDQKVIVTNNYTNSNVPTSNLTQKKSKTNQLLEHFKLWVGLVWANQ